MSNRSKKGWNGWSPRSREHSLEYKREWKKKTERERRDYFIRKRGGCCESCGCSVDLEFHHRLPQFRKTHRIFHYSIKKIEAELAHCDLLCKNPCHIKAQTKLKKPRQWCGL